jgi:hypothetical protein
VKQSSAIRKVIAGLAFLGVLTVGKSAFAAQGHESFSYPEKQADGSPLIAAGAAAAGIISISRRKG